MTAERPPMALKASPTINLASVVHGIDAYIRDLGGDPHEALWRAGLDVEDLSDPERRVPLLRYLELLEICAEISGDKQFGLKFGAQYDPRHAGVVGNVALASRTLGDALEMFARYLPTMVDSAVFGIEISAGVAFAYSYYVDPLLMTYRQKTDWAIGFMCNLVRVGLDEPRWVPIEAAFPHLPPEDKKSYQARAAVVGGVRVGHPWSGIRFDASELKRPMATADTMMERLMRHYGDLRLSALPDSIDDIERLRREIARLVVRGKASIGELAKSVGISSRTLQRRLGSAEITYAGLLDDVRKTLALNLLENENLALSEIAFSLGYGDASAFNHAFRRWTGMSPGQHRGRRVRRKDGDAG